MLPSSECRRVGGVNKKIINDFFVFVFAHRRYTHLGGNWVKVVLGLFMKPPTMRLRQSGLLRRFADQQ